MLNGMLAAMDGALMKCPPYNDTDIQYAFWKGFIQSNEVTNLFVWHFRGELVHAAVNYSGS